MADKPNVGKVIKKASANPVNIGVGAAAATLAIGLGSVPLAALGLVAYGAMVAFDTFNPTFWKKVYTKDPPPKLRLPEPKQVDDPGTRSALVQILSTKQELQRVLEDTPADVMATLAGTLASLQDLENQASRLIKRAEDVTHHLAHVNEDALRADADALAVRASKTKDPTAKAGFEEARAAREDELRTISELRSAKDRIDASLMHLVAVLGGLPTKVVHMRALDSAAADKFSGDLNSELETIADELKTSEEVMKSLGEVPLK
ncbi:MAG: hypothetical protein QM831_17260 [Kofleriaceae bacterium]